MKTIGRALGWVTKCMHYMVAGAGADGRHDFERAEAGAGGENTVFPRIIGSLRQRERDYSSVTPIWRPTNSIRKGTSMAAPDLPGRILRLEDVESRNEVEQRLNEFNQSKRCVVPECTGTMRFHKPLKVAHGAHTLEWPWLASWQCTEDLAHVQLISRAELHEILGFLYQIDPI